MPQTKIIILATISFFVCGSLALAGGLGLGFGLSDAFAPVPTPEPSATITAVSAYEPVERPAPRENLVLEDDFSGEGWDVLQDNDHRQGYEEARVHVAFDNLKVWKVKNK